MELRNHVNGDWVAGDGDGAALIDPVRGEVLARASCAGIDLGAALAYGRESGGPALRAMSFAERGALLGAIADALSAHRDAYFATALANSGNTKVDAAIDIDGGIGTLKYYARLGEKLGDVRYLKDGGFDRLTRDEAFRALHLSVPLAGVAVHVNAFNFPSWGLWEKAAVALLSGVPVMAKPATATALLAHQMVADVVAAGVLPPGALSLLCGGARDLLDHVTSADAVAFTGSAETANRLRGRANVIASSVRFNAEADSLNTSLLGPDAGPDSAEFRLFVREVAREMTIKAGQKCTAIRRAFVPRAVIDAVAEALAERLSRTVMGDPRTESVTMGPLVNKAQQAAALDGLAALAEEATTITGGDSGAPLDADPATSCFVAPTLLRCDAPEAARAVHAIEVFGPVCTLMPYDTPEAAFGLAGRGGGSLVASVFTGDDGFAAEAVLGLASRHGRVLVVDESVGKSQTGHGIVMPMCLHGGPGRAGGGAELGGFRGLRFYHQRLAVQGRRDRLEALAGDAAELAV